MIDDLWSQINLFLKDHSSDEKGKEFIVSMLVFRFASLEFEREYALQKAEKPGCEEQEYRYWKKGGIYFPPYLRWENLKEEKHYNLRKSVYNAMCIINQSDSKYKGLVCPESVLGDFDDNEISQIVYRMEQISYSGDDQHGFNFSQFYEYFIAHFIPRTIKQAGQYATPRQIADLVIELLEPKGGTIYDPCCGSGSMLLYAADYMRKKNRGFRLYGQEESRESWKTARMNLLLRGIDADLGDVPANSIRLDIHEKLKADYVLANPPFREFGWSKEQLVNDRRWKYGFPSGKRDDFIWMQHMLYHLDDHGTMGAIFSNRILASRHNEERRIRAALLQDDVLEAIITFPPGMFYATKVSVSLWILKKRKSEICRNKILFVDARRMGKTEYGYTRLSDSDRKRVVEVYQNYENGIEDDQPEFCRQVAVKDIETENYSLAPERYMIHQHQRQPELEELDLYERQLERELRDLLEENGVTLNRILKGK